MPFSSQPGSVGFRTQGAKGAYADPGAVAPNQGVFVKLTSGSLGGNRDLMIPDPEIGGHRDIPDAALGPVSYSGEFDVYLRPESAAFFLKAVLGSAASAGSARCARSRRSTASRCWSRAPTAWARSSSSPSR